MNTHPDQRHRYGDWRDMTVEELRDWLHLVRVVHAGPERAGDRATNPTGYPCAARIGLLLSLRALTDSSIRGGMK
jgi:hypothetical protein